jgi:hypothetical protein
MSIKKIWGTRSKSIDAATYVGESGTLFYDETDGELRLSNGTTAGGVAVAIRADLIVAQRLTPGADNDDAYGLGDETHRWWDAHIGDGGIYYNGFADPQHVPYIPSAFVDDIIPALDNDIDLGDPTHRFANIYLGTEGLFLADQTTDANINITVNEGTLYIDGAENLRLGNLAIRDTTLTSANSTLDISIGDAGDTGFFYVKRKAQIDNTTFSATEAMLSVNASGGAEPDTIFPDTLVQAVGRPNKNSRVVQRSYGSTGVVGGDNAYAVWASYAARGSVASPAALKENDILMRLSGNGYGTSTWGSGGARIEYVALENFTDSAKGTKINFWTTPAGQTASQTVASINSTGVVTAGVKFSGDETVQTTAGIPLSAKAVSGATYVATLGVDGKLDASQIPASLSGAVVFKGVWNATTNTPALSDTTPVGLQAGWEYIVEVGGTRDIGDGSKVFVSGDFVIYDGAHWKQVSSGNLFTSLTGGGGITVNQSTGAMTLGSTATPLSNVSTIVSRDSSGNFAANVITANLTGNVTGTVSGNAGTVTNGVYTNGSYANPSWLTSLAGSKVTNAVLTTDTGTVTNTMLAGSIANTKLTNSSVTVNGTAIALGASGTVTASAGTLTGTTLNATVVTSSLTSVGTLTNLAIATGGTITTPRVVINDGGIRTVSGGTTLTIDFATDSIILWTAPSGTAVITLSNYTAGAQVKLIIALTTTRDITFGISSAALSSTSADNWNGAGGGAIDVANTAVHLEYTCFTALAAGCYVKVTAN